jgi:uncharacterized protein (DUF2461 family)
MPDGPTLRRLREAIAADASGRKIATIVAGLRRKKYSVATHETSAHAPRGYDANHPRIELLRMKDLHAGKQLTPSSLSTRKAIDRVVDVMADIKPLSDWLERHVAANH